MEEERKVSDSKRKVDLLTEESLEALSNDLICYPAEVPDARQNTEFMV